MDQSYMKTKPVFGLLLSLSLPMVLSMLVSSLYNIVDSYFIAKISEDAMTALSLVFPLQNLINATAIGFGVGVNAVVAYYLGSQQTDKAGQAGWMGIALNFLHGLILTIVCALIIRPFLSLFSDSSTVVDLGVQYSMIIFGFTIFNMLGMTYEKIYQALGKMTVAMSCVLAGCIVNLVLDPIMIFGLGPIPSMGIQGAAIATGLGQTVNFVLYLIIGKIRPLNLKLKKPKKLLDMPLIARLYSIGLPALLNLALPSILISALNSILAGYSQAYVVVLGVYYKLQTFLYMPASGIVQGMRPLIGYNYGAGEMERVHRIFRTSLIMIVVIMTIGMAVCLVLPDSLISLFSDSAQTIEYGTSALRIICLGFVVSSISVAACGALEGLGMGMPSLWITLCRYMAVIIPAAWIFSMMIGATGVWWSFPFAELVSGIAAWFIYHHTLRKLSSSTSPAL